jgi:hypothetical protein
MSGDASNTDAALTFALLVRLVLIARRLFDGLCAVLDR